jgi:kynurenine formamidase
MNNNIIKVGLPINNGTNLYPMVKNESTNISPIKTVSNDGVEIWNISFTSLDCTYIETVRHISSEGPFPPEVFAKRKADDIYRAIIAHLAVEEGEAIILSELEPYLSKLNIGDALIVDANGYTEKWLDKNNGVINTDEYNLKSPYFSTSAIQGIIDAGVSILAGNFPSFSNPKTEEGFGIDMIAEFYKNWDNMILAPLINLDKIEDTKVVLQINPLVIDNCCGLPCCPIVYQGELKQNFMKFVNMD